jgi:hypothetical protein
MPSNWMASPWGRGPVRARSTKISAKSLSELGSSSEPALTKRTPEIESGSEYRAEEQSPQK